MKKNKIIGALALMMLGTSPAFAAENKSADFQASAEIENTCLIEADNVNFGQVSLPLSTQGTKSEMRVLCSKNTPYTIDLAYGGAYGTGTSNAPVATLYQFADYGEYAANYIALDGEYKGDAIYCYGDRLARISPNDTALSLPDVQFDTASGFHLIPTNSCNSDGRINIEAVNKLYSGNSAYDYGIMSGASKGDNLAYRITIPGDINKVWNSGNGSYKATATGEFEKIEVNAQIVPTNSSSLYIAQDSYTDTVTAIISY